MARKYLLIPIQLLFDPICFLVTVYSSFVYTILYVTFSAFPIVYVEVSSKRRQHYNSHTVDENKSNDAGTPLWAHCRNSAHSSAAPAAVASTS